jgi:hypothetical protein
MKHVALLAAVVIAIATPAIAQHKAASHASREAAIQLLRHEGILHGKTHLDSATWNGTFWLISLRHPDGKITNWTVDANAENYTSPAQQLLEIRGVEGEAVPLAIQSFKSRHDYKDEQGWPVYGDLRHYRIQLQRHRREFEVVFVPDPDPGSKTGGRTAYGWEVHYHFSLKPLKLLKEDYAR